MTKNVLGARILLALTAAASLLYAGSASAQIAPTSGPESTTATLNTTPQTTPESTPSIGQPLDRFVIVRGEPESFVIRTTDSEGRVTTRARPRPPSPARAFVREDEISYISESEWRNAGWSMEAFEAARTNNQHFCSVTANYVVRAAALAQRYSDTIPQIAAIQDRYIGMADDIRVAGRSRLGSNVFSTALAWIFGGPLTGGIVTSGAVGNEMQGRAWDQSMMLSRDAGVLNAELTGMHVEFSLLSLEMYADYLGLVTGYCTTVFGTDSTAS